MQLSIVQKDSSSLAEYARVPIALAVTSVRDVTNWTGGGAAAPNERVVPHPIVKDYDASPNEAPPSSWAKRCDLSRWALCAAYADGERVGGAAVVRRSDGWRQLATIPGHWVLRGFGLWAVDERSSGRFVGRVGLLEPSGWPGFEVAYTIAPSCWGRGYAREAAGAALRHAHEVLGRTDIFSIIRLDNIASVRVATALGATRSHSIEFFGASSEIYRYGASLTGAV